MDGLLLFVHIVAAGVWLGGNVSQFVMKPRFGTATAAFWRATVLMGRVQYTPAALVLLGTGLWMVARSSVYEYETVFVSFGVAVVLIGAVLGMAVFGPKGRKAAELRESGDATAAAKVERTLALFGGLDTVLVLLAIASMVWKWGF